LAHETTHQLTAVESFFLKGFKVVVGIGADFTVFKGIRYTVKWVQAFGL
jgi:hypothetical protein